MLNIERSYIYEEYENLNCIIEYPVIENFNNNLFIEYINKKIYDDILIFKEISSYENIDSTGNTIIFIDFNEHLNKNNIISLDIVFSEIYESSKIISYINTYNFDIERKRELLIEDIINRNFDIKKIINYNLNQSFYITKDYISIVFSSYENKDTSEIDEFKLYFKENENNISRYIKEYVMEWYYENIKWIQ